MRSRQSLLTSANKKKKLIYQTDLEVTTLILLTGAQIINVFGVSPTQTIKYQMGISVEWRKEHNGKMVVGEKVWPQAE